jgi:alanine-synthesizing transaminase
VSPLSKRTAFSRAENLSTKLLADARASGRRLVDLTVGNPTQSGFDDTAELLAQLGDARGRHYVPEPFGVSDARAAVADHYGRRGVQVDPARVVLTSSSSEAYSWLFKLLCDPGDSVLAPRPSYPLFPYLAALESVELGSYPLLREEHWRIDEGALLRTLDATPRVRALMMVHPSNPTGSYVHASDRTMLIALARARGLALIVDEVFVDYPSAPGMAQPSFASETQLPCFVLSGLSKVALLPQIKLGWMVVAGPEEPAREALARLEIIADSYLSVPTAVQLAAPAMLEHAETVQPLLRARLAANRDALRQAIVQIGDGCPVRMLASEGGWYALLELPRTRSDDEWLARTIEQAGVVVQPGYFFDMQQPGTMVVSLLPEPALFAEGIAAALALWSAG